MRIFLIALFSIAIITSNACAHWWSLRGFSTKIHLEVQICKLKVEFILNVRISVKYVNVFRTGDGTGTILVNGVPRETRCFRKLSRYIMQEDVHQSGITVMECMRFSADLKLGYGVPQDQKLTMVRILCVFIRKINSSSFPSIPFMNFFLIFWPIDQRYSRVVEIEEMPRYNDRSIVGRRKETFVHRPRTR